MTESTTPHSEPPAGELPFHLRGNFAPVDEEWTEHELKVSGAIPPELCGRFFRNGSNPKTGWSPHWFLGNGMIHGVELRDGRANWYRNRYVRTPLLENPEAPRIGPDGTLDLTLSCANTHVIRHDGRILALEEGSLPFEVTPELETVGAHDYAGKLKTAMTAHPRICPETGELLFFAYGAIPPYLTYHRVSADGVLIQTEEIDVKGPTMMHDWGVTRNHVIFMDLPMVFDLQAMADGGMPIRWSDEYGARLGVMPREGSNEDVVWHEIDPCYVFHPMNAYDDGNRIIMDVCHTERMSLDPTDGEGSPTRLLRWTIDRETNRVREEPLDERACEFPRVHDDRVGLPHRYGYVVGLATPEQMGSAFYKYDLRSGECRTHEFTDGGQAGEPVFAACPGADGEDEGWLLSFVYRPDRDESDLVILDATQIEADPVATIHIPHRVPVGFHGSWLPDDT